MNFEEKPLDKETSEFIVLHNNLIEARYRLTLQEKRIVLWLSSQVTTFDEDFKEHSLSIKDFSKLTNIQGENLYTRLQSITRRLMQRIITIRPIGEKRLIQVAWLGAADYKIDKGIISLSFHPHLKPFFLQLKRDFTKINISEIMGLQSIYSIRIYELLKQKELLKTAKIRLNEILARDTQTEFTVSNEITVDQNLKLDEIKSAAANQNPQLQAQLLAKNSAEQQLKQVKAVCVVTHKPEDLKNELQGFDWAILLCDSNPPPAMGPPPSFIQSTGAT